jgi:formylglycine-generating enzyme required for sulfatase activity
MTSEAGLVGLVGAVQRDLRAFEFTFRDEQFEQMRERIMRAFDPEEQVSLPMRVRLEAADALGQSGDPRLDGEQWVWMPAGAFLVGAQRKEAREAGYDSCALKNEGPCRKVMLPAFRVARFPVTVADYSRFIADSGYENAAYWRAGGFGEWKRPEHCGHGADGPVGACDC